MTPMEEIENLIARVSLGERTAFSALYDATSAKLLGVCLSVLKDRATAEDALQDSYVKVWKNADRYQVNGLSPMTWLITIARNTAIDHLRANRSDSDFDTVSETLPSASRSPEGDAIVASDARRIIDCMAQLEEDRRAAVKGAYLGGLSYADLARKFDVPMNTMRTWLRRSLVSLRECMSL